MSTFLSRTLKHNARILFHLWTILRLSHTWKPTSLLHTWEFLLTDYLRVLDLGVASWDSINVRFGWRLLSKGLSRTNRWRQWIARHDHSVFLARRRAPLPSADGELSASSEGRVTCSELDRCRNAVLKIKTLAPRQIDAASHVCQACQSGSKQSCAQLKWDKCKKRRTYRR